MIEALLSYVGPTLLGLKIFKKIRKKVFGEGYIYAIWKKLEKCEGLGSTLLCTMNDNEINF
jgi:hypothetical protein